MCADPRRGLVECWHGASLVRGAHFCLFAAHGCGTAGGSAVVLLNVLRLFCGSPLQSCSSGAAMLPLPPPTPLPRGLHRLWWRLAVL